MASLPTSLGRRTRRQTPDRSAETGDESSSERSRSWLARGLVAAGAGIVLAYVASRRAGSGDSRPSVEEIREQVGPGRAGTQEAAATVGGAGGSASGVRQRDSVGQEDSEDESLEAATDAVDVADERSAAELEELAESDVQAEPAEPGEMTVDDDVVDDLVDETDDGG